MFSFVSWRKQDAKFLNEEQFLYQYLILDNTIFGNPRARRMALGLPRMDNTKTYTVTVIFQN